MASGENDLGVTDFKIVHIAPLFRAAVTPLMPPSSYHVCFRVPKATLIYAERTPIASREQMGLGKKVEESCLPIARRGGAKQDDEHKPLHLATYRCHVTAH